MPQSTSTRHIPLTFVCSCVYLVETGAIIIDVTAHADESCGGINIEQCWGLIITDY